ncbi:MAG TPA: hypothetical protein VJ809_02265, partial [Pirellulales bacterium]|nr:hypothetical protein [Pirellulales bacterium]
GSRVARMLGRLVSSDATRSACQSVAQRLAGRDGIARTAVAVEAWAERAVGRSPKTTGLEPAEAKKLASSAAEGLI